MAEATELEPRLLVPVTQVSRKTKPFTKIRPEHLRILALFLQGKSRVAIANYLEISTPRVSAVLKNPAIEELIQEATADFQAEVVALQGPALDVVRERLKDPAEPAIALRASDMVFKMNHVYDEDPGKNITAEDVVSRLIAKRHEREIHIVSDGAVDVTIREGEQSCEVG